MSKIGILCTVKHANPRVLSAPRARLGHFPTKKRAFPTYREMSGISINEYVSPFQEVPQENYQYKRVGTFSKWNFL